MNTRLHSVDWTNALIGEYASLMHKSSVFAVAVLGSMIVTGCQIGVVHIWRNGMVSH